jgi:hypothetical protein
VTDENVVPDHHIFADDDVDPQNDPIPELNSGVDLVQLEVLIWNPVL